MVLVAVSASHALDRRPAINLAWEWVALGLIYLLLRNLPRTRDESSALAGIMVATAFAVSVYGLYQLTVELPLIRAEYLRNPGPMLATAGYRPWRTRRGAVQEPPGGFDRGLFDVWPGQFAGGFYRRSARARSGGCVPEPGAARRVGIAVGAHWSWRPRSFWCSLVCLILTKSRSAWLGLLVAMIVLALACAGRCRRAALAAAGVAGAGGSGGPGRRRAQGPPARSRGFDAVDDVAPLSLGVLARCVGRDLGRGDERDASPEVAVFLVGRRAGQFWGPYLKYKLPQSSEEILDPHNLFLEVWATAGVWALLALAAALAWGLWNMLAAARSTGAEPDAGPTEPGVASRVAADGGRRRSPNRPMTTTGRPLLRGR